MKGIYLGAFRAEHNCNGLIYQDINGKRDIDGDMMDIDLDQYDYVIATPPCNYWSSANRRRETSEYSQKTKHLLPDILRKLCSQDKPFIVENVRNSRLFAKYGLYDLPCFIYIIGRHTYWSNIFMTTDIKQRRSDNIKYITGNNRQGCTNVHNVIDTWLYTIGAKGNIDEL